MRNNMLFAAAILVLAIPGMVAAQGDPAARTDLGAAIEKSDANVPTGCVNTINGTLGSGSPDWPSTSGLQTGRLNRNGIASTCAAPKVCDIFLTDPGRAYDAYVFPNRTGASACASMVLTVIDQAGCNLQANAYLDVYDPTAICTGYLADPGFSSGTPPNPVGPFEGTVPDGSDLIVVVHTTNPGEIGCNYELVVSDFCVVPVDLQTFDVD